MNLHILLETLAEVSPLHLLWKRGLKESLEFKIINFDFSIPPGQVVDWEAFAYGLGSLKRPSGKLYLYRHS